MNNTILLRDMSSALNAIAGNDKVAFLRTGTLASGDLTISDLGLKEGAICYACPLFEAETVSSGAITVSRDGVGDTTTVLVMIIADTNDIA